jgi:predicted nucleic acid-binding protein
MDLAAEGVWCFYFSAPIQNEVERILGQKFGWNQAQIRARAGSILGTGIRVHPQITLAVIGDDPDDDRILECAVEAEVEAIISGDRHLLRLGSFQSIPIQTPRQFLESRQQLADERE